MNKNYITAILLLFFLFTHKANSTVTWERLFCKKSTDCFRSVHEVASGGFILAGYTSNFTPNDTDGFVVRLDNNGDTMWTFVYNGPASHEDLFYKVLPTSDGGFVMCGYSRSFSSSDNAVIVKINANGQFQWAKNWGGSGIEHSEDIIQLPDGKFVLCGYTTSSPAHYYDAFILKLDQTGNTLWSKIYGGSAYDDATSLLLLPDGGFMVGGQNNSQYYMIRTNSNGDSLWTKSFGTSGVDKIEAINWAQGGNGFVLVGTTDGIGAGGEDAYLVRTDTSGNILWAKTYGAALNDGFHRIEQTSDGGYIAVGTSTQGPLTNPNFWLVKLDVNGNLSWQNCYGGNDHDHGYTGQATSDGGYIIAGHTHSFMSNTNNEDALVIKTNGTGQVTNELTWTTVTQLLTPVVTTCGSANAQIKVEVANYGIQTVSNVPITIEITGAITQTIHETYPSSVAPNSKKTYTFSTTIDMSGGGTFNFHCFTGNQHDILPAHNYLDQSLTVGGTQPPPVTRGTHCGPGTVTLSISTTNPVQWYSSLTGGTSLGSGSTFTSPYITTNTTYYAELTGSCLTARVPVDASIVTSIASPVVTGGSHCGAGTVSLTANSPYTINWYSSAASTTILYTGATFTTASLSSTATYYVEADNSSCTSNRQPVNANILTPPADPSTVSASICGSGTVVLNATSSNLLNWYDAATGGNLVGTGNSYTTPMLTSSVTYYVQAHDVNCTSNLMPVVATVNQLPLVDLGLDTIYCSSSTYMLDAGAGYSNYQWSNSNISQTVTAAATGNYCVTVTDANNCTASDCAFVEFTVGVNDVLKSNSITLYPSPSHGVVRVEWITMQSQLHLSLLDITGKSIFEKASISNKEMLDLSFLSKGIYIVRLSDGNSVTNERLVIE